MKRFVHQTTTTHQQANKRKILENILSRKYINIEFYHLSFLGRDVVWPSAWIVK
jgi:hypothetical protein